MCEIRHFSVNSRMAKMSFGDIVFAPLGLSLNIGKLSQVNIGGCGQQMLHAMSPYKSVNLSIDLSIGSRVFHNLMICFVKCGPF